MLSIVQNLGLIEAESKRVDSIIHAIKRYVDGYVNETKERRNFCKRTQQVGESFDDFLVSLRELVKTCNFCSSDCTNKNIRDQKIIEGLLDADTTEDLLQETDLTLDRAITKCQAQKAAKKQWAHLHDHSTESIAALQKSQDQKNCSPTSIHMSRVWCPDPPSWPKTMSSLQPNQLQLPKSWPLRKSLSKQTT